MVDIWQLGFVLYGARTIERRFSVQEVFSQESAFVHARDGVNNTAGLQGAGGSSARLLFFSSYDPFQRKPFENYVSNPLFENPAC